MKRYILIFLVCFPVLAHAQQDALYSQYMFNPFAINPAYAGSRDALSAVLLHRSQWVGMDGAPRTSSLAVHGKLKGKKVALGFNAFSDRLGPATNTGVFATYAYHLKLGPGKLAMALRAGVFHSVLDRNLLDYYQSGDLHDQGGGVTALTPSFDAGAYYYTSKFFAGVSTTHIAGGSVLYSDSSIMELELDQHVMATTGFAIPVSESIVFRPSVLVRYVRAAPINFDINASFLFKKLFWLGASYRSSRSITFMSEFNIAQFVRIGYSYDMVFSRLKSYNAGSHELFLGIDLNVKKDKVISPRYL
jgi:type IX secretion system PorP/SprF family membrane protein